jgi:large subunit ribosomal protein L6
MSTLLNFSLKKKENYILLNKNQLQISGPLGKVVYSIKFPQISNLSFFTFKSKEQKTFSKLLLNIYQGLSNGYFVELALKGIGYRGFVVGNSLFLQLGFSHLLVYKFPSSVTIKCKKTKILVFGSDLNLVTQVASEIRNLRSPDSYKGKGILYSNEQLVLKVGKQR